MDIIGVEPRQLAPTVVTTGSGSTGSPALLSSSTIARLHLVTSMHEQQYKIHARLVVIFSSDLILPSLIFPSN
jgi:hypothetical protein